MKLAYIILIVVFLLTASYGLEMFFASLIYVELPAKVHDSPDDRKFQFKAGRIDGGEISKEAGCDVQALLSNNFFDQNRNAVVCRNETMQGESKLDNLYQLLGVLKIGDCRAAVIVNRNQPQRGQQINGKVLDKRIYLPGDMLGNGYKVSEIGTKSVKIMRNGHDQELSMFQNKKGTVHAGTGNVTGLPSDSNMSRPPLSLIGAGMEVKP